MMQYELAACPSPWGKFRRLFGAAAPHIKYTKPVSARYFP